MDESRSTRPKARELARASIRLAFFLRVPASDVEASWMQILVLIALTVAVPTVYAVITVGLGGRFETSNLPGALFHVPVMLLAATILSYLVDRGMHVRALLAAALLSLIPIDIIGLTLWAVLEKPITRGPFTAWGYYIAPLVWLSLALARFALSLAPARAWKKVIVVVASIVFLGVPLAASMREQSLWSEDWVKKAEEYAAKKADRNPALSEDMLYKQPELLQRQLADLQVQRKGVIDVYLVAIAGYGAQDVFMREVESVAKLFRERFDAGGHIVTLVNNPKTVMTYPLASQTSLTATLRRLAEVMDREEDILVLFLTSHGSQDHKFSIELSPFEMKALTPASIRESLDASGIRNRVVIVSACYAGGFVPGLQDDNTLVIAAAAANRNSFGCDNENEWTYFGKAYFDEALRKTTSFTAAFEAAKPVIEERERQQKYDPSDPQMSEGRAIRIKLAALDQQLARGVPAPVGTPAKPLVAQDKAERYVALIFPPEMAQSYLETCRKNMAMNGPDKTLERAPETMGGLDHSSPQWPRLVAAWEKYAENSCRRVNDAALYREVYLQQVRSTMTEAELDAALRMHDTDDGRRVYESEKRLMLVLADALAKRQQQVSQSLYQEFVTERDRLFAEAARRK